MQESGGRRVKRSINIDMTSVHFCTPEMLAKYRKIQLLKDYVDETEKVVEEYNKEHHIDNSVLVNGRRQTNLGVFRAYLTNYLKSLPTVNQDLTCMVRQLQPTETGIPLELYFFLPIKYGLPTKAYRQMFSIMCLPLFPNSTCVSSKTRRGQTCIG